MNEIKINIIDVAKSLFQDLIVESLGDGISRICYKSRYKISQPKQVAVPNSIIVDENFVEAIGLYIGDGKLSPKDLNHIDYITVDEDIAQFMWNFFQKRFYVNSKDVSFIIRYSSGEIDKIVDKWSSILGIEKNIFLTQKRTRYKSKDSITIQINSKILRQIFGEVIKIVLSEIKFNPNLRQAFLRGEFAADGKFGIEKDTNTYYISEVTFCYDAKKEVWLKDYIIECLKLEGIFRYHCIPGYIRMTGWDNYIKFWRAGLFDRCLRKKNKFLKVVRQAQIRLSVDKAFVKILLYGKNVSKNYVLESLNLHRTNLKRVLLGEQLLTLEQIRTLLKSSNYSWNDVIKKSKSVRIGRKTNLVLDSNFLNFLVNEKDLNTICLI